MAALAPLLTGMKEWELPETRRRMKDSKPCDVLPFIWNEFKEAGYVTSFNEDSPGIGTFTYRYNLSSFLYKVAAMVQADRVHLPTNRSLHETVLPRPGEIPQTVLKVVLSWNT